MVDLPPAPPRIAALPKDKRGYPVPWFICWMKDGKQVGPREPGAEPDFRMADGYKRGLAFRANRCWICGERLGVNQVFTIGPMCVVNRVTSEPASHRLCAEYAVKACPFLARPRMRRMPNDDMLEEDKVVAGIMLARNPGVTCLYETDDARQFNASNGWLIRLGPPDRVNWWREGRQATRAEVEESINSGLPELRRLAAMDGRGALDELEHLRQAAWAFLPQPELRLV